MDLSIKLIEAVLIEQDPEGLIKMGCPEDEYFSEAQKIYNRIITENRKTIIDYTSAVVFVFAEAFGSWLDLDDGGDFGYDKNYLIERRIDRFKIIGKLIFDMHNK